MATIKKSEVDYLRHTEKNYREVVAFMYQQADELWDWEQAAINASVRNQDLKDKLWAAEQEIHDLKYQVEVLMGNVDGLRKIIQERNEELMSLRQQINAPPEQIEIPACLKPKDALHYAAHHVVFYSPNTTSNIVDY